MKILRHQFTYPVGIKKSEFCHVRNIFCNFNKAKHKAIVNLFHSNCTLGEAFYYREVHDVNMVKVHVQLSFYRRDLLG